MRKVILHITVLAALGAAATAAAAPPSVQVLIRHQMRGCHTWAIGTGAYKATQHLVTAPGTTLQFTDNDVMPHRLVQVSGPKVALRTPGMNTPGAHASLRLTSKGTYVFKTKAGDDWMSGMETVGPDNVLKLVVVVK
jgi:plastocyanin